MSLPRRAIWPAREDSCGSGALAGIRVLDISQNAPGPMASMMLADFDADVIHVVPPTTAQAASGYLTPFAEHPLFTTRFSPHDAVLRNKRTMTLDLKSAPDRDRAYELASVADVLIEEMRPDKTARLGLGYEALARDNPGLVYVSITGFGQTGPRAGDAGHDINYLALSGVLDMLRDGAGRPHIPLNLLGDYAGGGIMAAFAILVALQARGRSGLGQYIDMSMTDGITYAATDLMSVAFSSDRPVRWTILSGEAPSYTVYRCRDGLDLAVGALERRFAAAFCTAVGRPDLISDLDDQQRWPTAKAALEGVIATRDRADWLARFGADCCVTPVLGVADLKSDEQAVARSLAVATGPIVQAGIGPKLHGTPGRLQTLPGADHIG